MRTAYVILLMIIVWVSPARPDVIWCTYYEKTSGEPYMHGDSFLKRYGPRIGLAILNRTTGLRYAYDNVFKTFEETPYLVCDISFVISPNGSVKNVSAETTSSSATNDVGANEIALRIFEDAIEKTVPNFKFRDLTETDSRDVCDWTVKLPVRFVPENAPVEETTPEDWYNTSTTKNRGFKYFERVEKREAGKYIIVVCIIDGVEFDEIVIKSRREQPITREIWPARPAKAIFEEAAKNRALKTDSARPVKSYLSNVASYFEEKNRGFFPSPQENLSSNERKLRKVEAALADGELRLAVADLGLSDEYDWDVKRPNAKKLAKLREKQKRLTTEIEQLNREISAVEETWSRSLADKRAALIARGEELLSTRAPEDSSPWLAFALAELYLDSGEAAKAAALFEQVLETRELETNDEVLYGMARSYLLAKDDDKASKTFNRLTQEHPESRYAAEANFRLGEYFTSQLEPNKAEEYFLRASRSDDECRDAALYRAAWAYYGCSDPLGTTYYDRAVPAFKRFLDGAEEDSAYWDRAIEMTDVCLAEWEPGTAERPAPLEALSRYEKVFGGAEERPYSADVLRAMGDAYLYTMDRLAEAAATYGYLLEKYPYYERAPAVVESLVETHLRREGYDEAHDVRIRIVDEYGPDSSWCRAQDDLTRCRALLSWENALYEVAVYFNMQAERKNRKTPEEARPLFGNAIDRYNQYLASFPTNEKAYHINFYFAEAYYEVEDYENAAKQYIKTATGYADRERYNLDKWDERFTQEESLFNATLSYGKLYKKSGELVGPRETYADKLLSTCEEFLARFGDGAEAARVTGVITKIGDVYARKGDGERAREYYLRVIEEYPEPVYIDSKRGYTDKEVDASYIAAIKGIADTYLEEAKLMPAGAEAAEEKYNQYRDWFERAKAEAEKRKVDFEYQMESPE